MSATATPAAVVVTDTTPFKLALAKAVKQGRPTFKFKGVEYVTEHQGRRPEDVPGLTGKSLETYLTTGQHLTDQIKNARPVSKENTMPAKSATKSTGQRTRKGQPESKQSRAAKRAEQSSSNVLTAAQVARDNELDGFKFRKFLRAQGIERKFASKADARKAVNAFRKSA